MPGDPRRVHLLIEDDYGTRFERGVSFFEDAYTRNAVLFLLFPLPCTLLVLGLSEGELFFGCNLAEGSLWIFALVLRRASKPLMTVGKSPNYNTVPKRKKAD